MVISNGICKRMCCTQCRDGTDTQGCSLHPSCGDTLALSATLQQPPPNTFPNIACELSPSVAGVSGTHFLWARLRLSVQHVPARRSLPPGPSSAAMALRLLLLAEPTPPHPPPLHCHRLSLGKDNHPQG